MRDRNILLTGSTGFVGRAIVEHLTGLGVPANRLRLLVRDARRAESIGLPRESLLQGDLGDREALLRSAREADLVFHVAGAVKALSRRQFFRVNGDGTALLVDVLLEVAPGCRLVHVSSLAAAGPSVDGENSALSPEHCAPRSHYGASKRQGELHVQSLGGRLPWVIVLPGIVYGPGDVATRLLFRQALAPVAAVPWTPRPLSLIHVRDLVEVLMRAASSPWTRRVFPVEGPNRLSTDELVVALAAACGRRARLLRLPLAAVWPVALGCDMMAQLRRRPALMGLDKLRDLRGAGWVADPRPARNALDFVPRISTSLGFRETAAAEGFVDLSATAR